MKSIESRIDRLEQRHVAVDADDVPVPEFPGVTVRQFRGVMAEMLSIRSALPVIGDAELREEGGGHHGNA